jgi:hypothetical protein
LSSLQLFGGGFGNHLQIDKISVPARKVNSLGGAASLAVTVDFIYKTAWPPIYLSGVAVPPDHRPSRPPTGFFNFANLL